MRKFHFSPTRTLVYCAMSALAVSPFLQGCGSSSTTSTTSSCSTTVTSLQSGICAAQAAMALAPHSADSSPTAFNFLPRFFHRAQIDLASIFFPEALATSDTLTPFWTTSTAAHDLYDGATGYTGTGYESPQNWMGQEMDSSFVNSGGAATTPFGRADIDQFMVCILGSMTNQMWPGSIDTDNLLKAGNYSTTSTVNFADASSGTFMGCNVPSVIKSSIASMGSIPSGTPVLTVTSVTGTTYTKAYALSGSGTYYLKLDTTNHILNMGVEKQDKPGSPAWGDERQLLSVNGNVTDFEYVAQTYCGGMKNYSTCTGAASAEGNNVLDNLEMYRFHIDTGNNVAYVFGNYGQMDDAEASGGTGGSESFTRYALAGKPNNLNSISTSLMIAGMAQGQTYISVGGTAQNFGNGCISASSGSITSDGTLNCDLSASAIDLTGSGSGATSANGVAEKTITNHASTATSYTATYAMDGNTAINWTTFDTNTSTGIFGVPSTTN